MTSHHPCFLRGFLDRDNIEVLAFVMRELLSTLFSSTLMAFIVQTSEKYKNVLVFSAQCMFVEMNEHEKMLQ